MIVSFKNSTLDYFASLSSFPTAVAGRAGYRTFVNFSSHTPVEPYNKFEVPADVDFWVVYGILCSSNLVIKFPKCALEFIFIAPC